MVHHRVIRFSLLLLVAPSVAMSFINSAHAAKNYCPAPKTQVSEPTIRVSANQAFAHPDGYARLDGNVQVIQGDNKLRANQVDYNYKKRKLNARDQVLYTNCNVDDPSWFITADRVSIDKNRAVAKDAWLVVAGVPLLYLPRYHITLDKTRETGFLTPGLNSGSEVGLDIKTPFYLNLAPNQDLTLTPHWLTRRGLQLNNDYRYLTGFGQGTIHADWLSDRKYVSDRYAYTLHHDTTSQDLKVDMLYQRVSDIDYTSDFRGPLKFIDENYLHSYAQIEKVWNGWHINSHIETIQASDNNANFLTRPVEKRPEISLSKRLFTGYNSGEINLHTSWTQFDFRAPETISDKVGGQRFDNFLQWQLPLRRPGFYLTPTAQIRYTGYDLKLDTASKVRQYPNKISRTIPSFSFKSGLIFEKQSTDGHYKKILEPQIYYLNVPYRTQSSIPLFDTTQPEFRFNQLFDDNRFEGVDRIGDADQLSFALTHKILHSKSGKEIIRASLGQIFYFRNNKVALNTATATPQRSKSDIAAELSFSLNEKVKFYNTISWNNDTDHTQQTINRLSLNAGNNRLINLFHHYRRDEYKQLGINFSLPVANQWKLFGGYSYDTRSNRDLLTVAGLEYQSCCWSLRLLGQRFLKDIDGDGSLATGQLNYDRTIGIELNFRGLGSLETSVDNILENRITGYNYR